jgi:hypothetical protein
MVIIKVQGPTAGERYNILDRRLELQTGVGTGGDKVGDIRGEEEVQ